MDPDIDIIAESVPLAERIYLATLTRELQQRLSDTLVGVWLFGSASLGAYQPGVSDLDVQVVVEASPAERALRDLAAALSHRNLPCPARCLELVCYTRHGVDGRGASPEFCLNFNTGAAISDRIVLSPREESPHWFVLDVALGRQSGIALIGPPAASVFAPIPRAGLLEAMRQSLRWHEDNEACSANSALNALRGWRYAVTGCLGSKPAALDWAGAVLPATTLETLRRARRGSAAVPPAVFEGLLRGADTALRRALNAGS
jgi:hypothetical protein